MRPAPAADPTARVSLKAVWLPAEHGGWGLLAEPLVLGLALAPSAAVAWLALAAAGAFLARQPLKLALADWQRRARYPRTAWAEAGVAVFGLTSLLSLGAALATAQHACWMPLAAAAPLALLQLWFDVRHQGRRALPETAGAVALAATVAAGLMAAGWGAGPACAAWALLAIRGVSSVLYVRARLRLDRGVGGGTMSAYASHVLALVAAVTLAGYGWAPWLGTLAFLILLGRAGLGLSARRAPLRPRALGMRELGFGLTTVALLAVGYGFGL